MDLCSFSRALLVVARLRKGGLCNIDFGETLLVAQDEETEAFTEPIFALPMFEVWRARFKVQMP